MTDLVEIATAHMFLLFLKSFRAPRNDGKRDGRHCEKFSGIFAETSWQSSRCLSEEIATAHEVSVISTSFRGPRNDEKRDGRHCKKFSGIFAETSWQSSH